MAVVRYGDQRVYLKWLSGGLLCVVVTGRVNMPALRMGANLVCRRISAAVEQAERGQPPGSRRRERTGADLRSTCERARAVGDAGASYPGMRRFRDRPAG